jgi:hypothetical protein
MTWTAVCPGDAAGSVSALIGAVYAFWTAVYTGCKPIFRIFCGSVRSQVSE